MVCVTLSYRLQFMNIWVKKQMFLVLCGEKSDYLRFLFLL